MCRRNYCGVVFLALALLASVIDGSSSCQCSAVVDSTRQHPEYYKSNIEFSAPLVIGEVYQRALFSSPMHTPHERMFTSKDSDLSTGCDAEQIHINLGGDGYSSVTFSFVTTNSNLSTPSVVYVSTDPTDLEQTFDEIEANDRVWKSKGTSIAFSENVYIHSFIYNPLMGAPMVSTEEIVNMENTADFAYDHKTGKKWAYWAYVTSPQKDGLAAYNNPYTYYDSPRIHTTSLSGMTPSVLYYYRVSGSCIIYQFSIFPQETYPMTIALTGDLGQTAVSQKSLAAMEALNPDVALLVGDLSYADGYVSLWDPYGNMMEPFAAQTPMLTTGGNHEFMYGENSVSYKLRWPTPLGTGSTASAHYCYWGREVGVMHVIALCSYAGFEKGSMQYAWLENYLGTQIDRKRTPWIVVMIHTPLYNSNNVHWMEGELMRRAVEPILYQYGVDIVLCGHVHAYERTYPVYNNTVDECGITYLNLGDGGNFERGGAGWRFNPTTNEPPEWTAFREDSFGVGGLVILSDILANYSWHRHACSSDDAAAYYMNFSESCTSPTDNSVQRMLTSDSVLITRPSILTCPNKYVSTAAVEDAHDNGISPTTVSLIALSASVGILGIVLIGLSIKLYFAYGILNSISKNSSSLPIDKRSLRYNLLDNVITNEDVPEA